jgi:DNA-binding PadR family transcriptional regulator
MRMDRNCRGRGRDSLPVGVMFNAARHGGSWGGPFGGAGFDWDGDGAGRRGRGGRGRMFGSGELRLVLLKLIGDEARHGYQLIKAVEELTEGAYAPSPGVVYPTLSLLADEGAIAENEDEGARKSFAITDQGRAELADKQDEVERILARLADHGESHGRRHAPQIARALGNLMMVLRQSNRGNQSADRHNEIVDILDEAAKRIERL